MRIRPAVVFSSIVNVLMLLAYLSHYSIKVDIPQKTSTSSPRDVTSSRTKRKVYNSYGSPFVKTFEDSPKENGNPREKRLPSSIPLQKPMQLTCHSCAVVSNSGQLLNQSAGTDIDHADCVIRMNDAPTAGFEQDVGRRTTIRVIGHTNLIKMIKGKNTFMPKDPTTWGDAVIVVWLYRTSIHDNPAYRGLLRFSQIFKNVKFYCQTNEMTKYSNQKFLNETGITRTRAHTWLTTGWHTMLLAIDICNHVTVYGMVDNEFCLNNSNSSTPYHYYESRLNECKYYKKSEERTNGGHLFVTEKFIFGRWSQKHNITFRYPEWQLRSFNESFIDTPFIKLFREELMKTRNYTLSPERTAVDGSANETDETSESVVEFVGVPQDHDQSTDDYMIFRND